MKKVKCTPKPTAPRSLIAGPVQVAPGITFELHDAELRRIEEPWLDELFPIDHNTVMGTLGGIREGLGFCRLPLIREHLGEQAKLSDVRNWLRKRNINSEGINWTDFCALLRQETACGGNQALSRTKEESIRLPVSKRAGRILERLKSLPESGAMDTSALMAWYNTEYQEAIDDRMLRKALSELKPYGLQNKPKTGYFVR